MVGFAITGPATDPDCDPVADAELRELTVDPDERGKGHGSRLLQAAADTMAADRFTRAVTWVLAADDALRAFLTDAGWARRLRAPRARPRRDRRDHGQAGPAAHRARVSLAARQDAAKPARVVSVRPGGPHTLRAVS